MDSGMLHAAVRYYRRTGDEQYAIALTQKAPQDPEALRNSGRWWYERQLLMRWALREGRFGDAYLAAAHHGLEPGSSYAEAEFNAGWIALRFLNEPQRAETHFWRWRQRSQRRFQSRAPITGSVARRRRAMKATWPNPITRRRRNIIIPITDN